MDGIDHDFADAIRNPILILKATRYAAKKTAPFRNTSLSIFINPDDIVNESIKQTLEGTRPWDQSKCPDPFVHLAGCMRSIISNYSTKKESLTTENYENHNEILGDAPSPEEEYSFLEMKSMANEFINIIKEKSPDLFPMAIAIIKEEIFRRKDLAKFLNKTVSEVDNDKMRLRRFYRKHFPKEPSKQHASIRR